MPEELLARLKNLEDSYYGDKEVARQKQFFDTYGERFSNNRGLGLAILNELDARGIDTSAADEAVTQILDQLRTECNEIINSIKVLQENAIDNAQKVEAIQNVVDEQVANNPASTVGAQPATDPAAAVPENENIAAMNPADQPQLDLPADYVPEEGGEEPEPPVPEEGGEEPEPPVPEEGGEEPEPELPPNEVTSDIRMKRIQRMKDHWGKTRAQKKKEAEGKSKDSWKPDASILKGLKED